MSIKKWSLHTRFLHLGLVATVSAQLFISLVMDEPGESEHFLGAFAYNAHEVIGLAALIIVASHWLWSILSERDGGLRRLFPWFGQARKSLFKDLKKLLPGRWNELGDLNSLAGFVHGLGLLAVSGAAITGAIIFATYPEYGNPSLFVKGFEELHEGMATLVWVYWIGHGGAALIHHLAGHDTLKNMFSMGQKTQLAQKPSELAKQRVKSH